MENENLDTVRDALLRKPYQIIDILPARTPARFAAAYSALEKYCFRDPKADMPYTRFLNLIVKLGCYCDIAVCRADDEEWLCSPEPEYLSNALRELAETRRGGLHFMINGGKLLITLDADDLYMTMYGSSLCLIRRIKQLASSEGLFVWKSKKL
ncbi:MAG: hypothetical protein K6F68_08835 [Clostridiales bacterium]|nr:hypothetical protein [Clostridiales bacterium]